ncbi:hypothetical protein MKX03_010199 [Papaver bracteatum]|nr:hypothetical protein MKX03_010199 [Papaver bracteatum]
MENLKVFGDEEFSKKETVKSADSPLEIWRSKLPKQRVELKHLLDDWRNNMTFKEKERVFSPYLNTLVLSCKRLAGYQFHEDRSEVLDDLDLLEKLVTLLELDVAEGLRNHFRCQIAIAYALKKIGLLLRNLDGISPDADLRAWIMEKLNIDDWEDYLYLANAHEGDVLFRAAAEGVELEKQIIAPETIRVQDVDEFKSRLEVYHRELKAAFNMPHKNIDCIGGGPSACSLIKGIKPKLRYRHLANPDGNIKEERRDGDHQTMTREVSSAKRARGTSNLDMTTMKKKKGGAGASVGSV